MKVLGVTAAPVQPRPAPLNRVAASPADRYAPSAESPDLLPRPLGFAERVARVQSPLAPGGSTPGFRQTVPALVDPEGDAQLIRLLDRLPEKLTRALFQRAAHGEKWDQRDGTTRPPHRVGHESPYDLDALERDFQRLVQETGLPPKLGHEHEWSPEAQKYRHLGFWRRVGSWMRGGQDFPAPELHFSKLFLMLAAGNTSRFAITGQEAALDAALMRYPDRSVKPADLLRESYVLNRGDLYSTLLTAENVLARDPFDAHRDEQPLQRKLAYIRHDTPEVGDNFAAWYHFFGTALYALMRPAGLAATVARVESLGSLFLEGPDRQETLVNKQGARFGSWLRAEVG